MTDDFVHYGRLVSLEANTPFRTSSTANNTDDDSRALQQVNLLPQDMSGNVDPLPPDVVRQALQQVNLFPHNAIKHHVDRQLAQNTNITDQSPDQDHHRQHQQQLQQINFSPQNVTMQYQAYNQLSQINNDIQQSCLRQQMLLQNTAAAFHADRLYLNSIQQSNQSNRLVQRSASWHSGLPVLTDVLVEPTVGALAVTVMEPSESLPPTSKGIESPPRNAMEHPDSNCHDEAESVQVTIPLPEESLTK
jgi:hypothetical protein